MVKARNSVVVWIDIETGGLNWKVNPILSIGIIITDKMKIVTKTEIFFQPDANEVIEDSALIVNGIKRTDIAIFPETIKGIKKLKKILDDSIHLTESQGNKYYAAGHNITKFDMPFIRAWLNRKSFNFDIDQYFHLEMVDTQIIAKSYVDWAYGNKPKNNKLTSITDFFQIDHIGAHTALADAEACMKAYIKMVQYQKNDNKFSQDLFS